MMTVKWFDALEEKRNSKVKRRKASFEERFNLVQEANALMHRINDKLLTMRAKLS